MDYPLLKFDFAFFLT